MREIKLRSYNKESGIFFYFYNGKYYSDSDLCYCVSERVCSEFQWGNARQYTGLRDKNGEEIYDGDIIKGVHRRTREEYSRTVSFKDGMFVLLPNHGMMFDYVMVGAVIGNIDENPELLET